MRVYPPSLSSLTVLVLLSLGPAAYPADYFLPMRFFRQNQHRMALQSLYKMREQDPDDPEIYAMLGSNFSRLGMFADAQVAFSFAEGSEFYSGRGLADHADQRRAMGDYQGALSLRWERLLEADVTAGQELMVWLNAADDMRLAGQYETALQMADAAVAEFPRSPMAYAVIAEIYLDAGDREEAESYLWLSRDCGGVQRRVAVEVRIAFQDGDLEEAGRLLEEVRMFRNPTSRLAAQRAELCRLEGDPVASLAVLARSRWKYREDPELWQVQIKAHVDLGPSLELDELLAKALEIYPKNPWIQDARAYYEAQLGG